MKILGNLWTLFWFLTILTFSQRWYLSYRNQSIDLQSKLMNWFLYDRKLRHESVKLMFTNWVSVMSELSVNYTKVVTEFESINPLTTSVPHQREPVNWFATQISWLVSIWWRALFVNGLRGSRRNYLNFFGTHKITCCIYLCQFFAMLSPPIGPSKTLLAKLIKKNVMWIP